jgi:hypothetical protein
MLERLVRLGACTPAKRDAVLSWPGFAPCGFDTRGPLRIRSLLGKRLSHLKLACHPERPLEAKAYLACWIQPA